MLVSLNWLKEYVDYGSLSPEELGELITKSGIEVDGILRFAEESENIVVGYVTSCEQHPNADQLKVCQVDVGEEKLQIICGAPNVAKGQKVAVAKPGALLPGDLKIEKVEIRGVESKGMICSLQELGVVEQYIPQEVADGIFVFPDDVEVGQSVTDLLNLDDAILEFDLTPNRADSLSMLGVAYEVSAILDVPIEFPDETYDEIDEDSSDYVSVEVEDAEKTPFYGAFIIKDVEIKPSPLWMRNYLMASGIRPINNVVDITNYVLLEYGQPLHAFDYDLVKTKKVLVRPAKEGETIVTLDEQERKLTPEDLVITNGEEPIALAGVMGGLDTEVHEGTTTILLEAAYFDPATVRRTVLKTGLRSEASNRFEKGIDPIRVEKAGRRACQLLQKYANGKVLANPVFFDELDRTEKIVEMNTNEVNKRLGTEISTGEIEDILRRLQFAYELSGDDFTVSIPTRRVDISIFEDMVEEVARIYGYDRLPYTLPENASTPGALTLQQRLKREIKRYVQGAGLSEAITYSLTDRSSIDMFVSPEFKEKALKPVELAMPLSDDHRYLRISIIPELLKTLSYNRARDEGNVAFYEMGSIFLNEEEQVTKQPEENLRLAGALTGLIQDHKWQKVQTEVDFYVVKGIVEGLMEFLKLPVNMKQTQLEDFHPGRCATIYVKDHLVGMIGQVHPKVSETFDLKDTYVFDINLYKIFSLYRDEPAYTPVIRYPSIVRDVALIVPKEVTAMDLQNGIFESDVSFIQKVEIFDVYEGENLAKDKKSIAYRIYFQHAERTLTDKEADQAFEKIVEHVREKYNAEIRS